VGRVLGVRDGTFMESGASRTGLAAHDCRHSRFESRWELGSEGAEDPQKLGKTPRSKMPASLVRLKKGVALLALPRPQACAGMRVLF